MDRSVLSVAVNAVDHSACAVLRLVAADPAALDRAGARLAAAGWATALPDAQRRRAGGHPAAGRWRPVPRRPRQPGAHVITTEVLPAPAGATRESVRAVLELPPAGVLIGADRQQAPVALPAIGPRPTRLGVLGDHRIATLLAYRLLGVGCRLRVATADPGRWRRCWPRPGPGRWSARAPPSWPPTGPDADEPQLLVTDLPAAPTPGLGDRPLSTVVRIATAVPTDSPYWAAVHGVVLAGPATAPRWPAAGPARSRRAGPAGPRPLGLLDRSRAIVVTPILAEAELALLTDYSPNSLSTPPPSLPLPPPPSGPAPRSADGASPRCARASCGAAAARAGRRGQPPDQTSSSSVSGAVRTRGAGRRDRAPHPTPRGVR